MPSYTNVTKLKNHIATSILGNYNTTDVKCQCNKMKTVEFYKKTQNADLCRGYWKTSIMYIKREEKMKKSRFRSVMHRNRE